MGVIRQEFLTQTISCLETLKEEFLNNLKLPLPEEFLRQFFRQLHTIKGTSKTFDLNELALLAHEIENLLQSLQSNQILLDSNSSSIIQEGFENLLGVTKSYQAGQPIAISPEFVKKLRELIPNSADLSKENKLERLIPANFIKNLSTQEKNSIFVALENDKYFYLLRADFSLATFYEDFKNSKTILNEHGEVIAVSPAATANPTTEIAFEMFFVTDLTKNEVEKLINPLSVLFETRKSVKQTKFSNDLNGVIKQVLAESERNAQKHNKKVEFTISSKKILLSNETLLLISQIVSHLVNNAIVHAIETVEERIAGGKDETASIKINVSDYQKGILLQIEDNGKGLDIEKISEQAKHQHLLTLDHILDEKEAIELIFSSGFSTSQKVSDISGRGVGLDAVKNLVDKANGKIEVDTKSSFGTTFSVYLPQS